MKLKYRFFLIFSALSLVPLLLFFYIAYTHYISLSNTQIVTTSLNIMDQAVKEQKTNPLLYPVKGKRATKTVFIAEKLQFLINEYCIENDLKIGDVVECAIIQYLNQNGYDEKLKSILNTTEVTTP